jgi:hypothetical protein
MALLALDTLVDDWSARTAGKRSPA